MINATKFLTKANLWYPLNAVDYQFILSFLIHMKTYFKRFRLFFYLFSFSFLVAPKGLRAFFEYFIATAAAVLLIILALGDPVAFHRLLVS